jgi:plastocyanin
MRERASPLTVAIVAALVAALGVPRAAGAGDAPAPTAADVARLETEIARVRQQLAEQRQLILQVMQMHDALLRYLQTGDQAGVAAAPRASALAPTPSDPGAAPAGAANAANAANADRTPRSGPLANETGVVSGRVTVNGGAPGEAYVFLEGSRQVPSHPPTIEIRQEGRQFVPAVAVVPVGSHVLFPNRDRVFHNVFSNTPGDAFDVGKILAGQTPQPVTLLKAGHVEVFCEIHSSMRADVLVVPNAHWTRVRADGTFQLPGVPAGVRRLAVWGPSLKPVSQQVEVKASGATATFATEARSVRPHLNKSGGAYGSYEN